MMERIASRSWVLDGGQKDGGEAWSETQEINRSTWFITTGFKYVFADIAADYNPFSINDKENLTVSFKKELKLNELTATYSRVEMLFSFTSRGCCLLMSVL